MYNYRVYLERVIDGDTCDVTIDLGFDVQMKHQRIRIFGLNTPESRTRDLEEKARGLEAKEYSKKMLEEAEEIILISHERGKYGRILGELICDGVNLNDSLIADGHAVPYFGGKR